MMKKRQQIIQQTERRMKGKTCPRCLGRGSLVGRNADGSPKVQKCLRCGGHGYIPKNSSLWARHT